MAHYFYGRLPQNQASTQLSTSRTLIYFSLSFLLCAANLPLLYSEFWDGMSECRHTFVTYYIKHLTYDKSHPTLMKLVMCLQNTNTLIQNIVAIHKQCYYIRYISFSICEHKILILLDDLTACRRNRSHTSSSTSCFCSLYCTTQKP